MKVIAHRGYSGRYPENTMLAFRKAVEAGSDGIELDVQTTKDGVVVVIHDEKVDRTTDGTGSVKDYTFEELRKLNAAKLFPHVTDFEPIPSLEEYCAWMAQTDIFTNIEIKTGVYYYEDIEKKTIDIVRKYGLEDRILFSSFNLMSLVKVKKLAPEIPCGALMGGNGLGNAGYCCKSSGFEYYHPGYKTLNEEIIENCKTHGIKLNVWTVNDMAELEKLYEWGCNGVITNFPEVCKAYVKHKSN